MIIEKPNAEYAHCRIPGLVLTDQGSLLGCYECRRYSSDWADIDLKIIRSTDKGDIWETTLLIPSHGNTMNNPVLIADGKVIHFLYCENYIRLFYCKSDDDGKSWSTPIEFTHIFDDCGFFFNVFAVGPGHGIRYKDKLIVPVWFAANRDNPKAHWPSFMGTIYSTDGSDWKLGEIITQGKLKDANESALAVNADGELLISIRSHTPERLRSFATSKTGIDSWEGLAFREGMTDPWCQGSMCDFEGTVYHVNCDNATERNDLAVKISRDNFKTFETLKVDPVGGYADIATDGNELFVFYEHVLDCELYFERIKLK